MLRRFMYYLYMLVLLVKTGHEESHTPVLSVKAFLKVEKDF